MPLVICANTETAMRRRPHPEASATETLRSAGVHPSNDLSSVPTMPWNIVTHSLQSDRPAAKYKLQRRAGVACTFVGNTDCCYAQPVRRNGKADDRNAFCSPDFCLGQLEA